MRAHESFAAHPTLESAPFRFLFPLDHVLSPCPRPIGCGPADMLKLLQPLHLDLHTTAPFFHYRSLWTDDFGVRTCDRSPTPSWQTVAPRVSTLLERRTRDGSQSYDKTGQILAVVSWRDRHDTRRTTKAGRERAAWLIVSCFGGPALLCKLAARSAIWAH